MPPPSGPLVIQPRDGEVGVRLDSVLTVTWRDGAADQVQVQVSLENTFPADAPDLVYDTGLRDVDGWEIGTNYAELAAALFGELQGISHGAVGGETYYLAVRTAVGGADGTVTTWSPPIAFTFEAAPLTADESAEAA